MPDESRESFVRFMRLAGEVLRSDPPAIHRGGLRLVSSSPASLKERVEDLEAREEFQALCNALEGRLNASGFGSHGWKGAVGHWFRRSGLYHRVAAGEALPGSDTLLDGLLAELSPGESTVTYLGLLEHVSFRKPRMEFERYEIVRYSKEELDQVLESQVRADFYPWTIVPTGELAPYWWLVVRQQIQTNRIGPLGGIPVGILSELDIVRRYYTELPPAVESALRELALFYWRSPWATDNDPDWHPCRIPICLRMNAHLATPISGPRADTSVLDTEPFFDPDTREYIGERPHVLFHLSASETEAFEIFVRREGTLLHRALGTAWSKPLVETASNFFAKAFVADGVEQLLWHMTTIEALIGEQGEGGTARLARRLSQAIAASDSERETIRRKFRELYDFRSDLVHGRKPEKVVLTRHLFGAREFARNLLRWNLRLLADIHKAADAAGAQADMPDRSEILRLLDLETEGLRKARWLISSLPGTFPRYPGLSE